MLPVWFLTGDLGTIDEGGYLRLTGRKKELIVRGGHNINPNLLEDLALRHPGNRSGCGDPGAGMTGWANGRVLP